jgi:flagellar basal body rod protein FlgB
MITSGVFAMSSPVASVVEQISAAMSVCNLQHQVNVANIANRDTQGYQRLKLQFDHAMDHAAPPRVVTDQSSAPVSLEQDLVSMSTNLMQYQTMARAVGRYFSLATAIANPNRG